MNDVVELPVEPSAISDDQIIVKRTQQYRDVRAAITAMEGRHKEELSQLKDVKERLKGVLNAHLIATGATSVKTPAGTFYRTERLTAVVKDPKAFMDQVVANQDWDLIERRANAAAVRDFIKTKGHGVPGVDLNVIQSIGVIAPTKSKVKGDRA
jgi:hypothetical protein